MYIIQRGSIKNEKVPISYDEALNFVMKRSSELLDELIKQRGHSCPPFLAQEYAKHLGCIKRIEEEELGEIDALLIGQPDGYIIKVDKKHSPVRKNFSCAHEIAHTFLHELNRPIETVRDEYRFTSSVVANKDSERLCQEAAAELLMPQDIFRRHLESFGVSINSVERLAQVFEVSIQAAAIRISQVTDKTCETILWRQCQKHTSNGFKKGFKGYFMRRPQYRWRNSSKIFEAFDTEQAVKHSEVFKIGNEKIRCQMESKGFGYGQTRYVISLAFPQGQ
jgi:Zn-dependent peptidase ImmA (M78 family)